MVCTGEESALEDFLYETTQNLLQEYDGDEEYSNYILLNKTIPVE